MPEVVYVSLSVVEADSPFGVSLNLKSSDDVEVSVSSMSANWSVICPAEWSEIASTPFMAIDDVAVVALVTPPSIESDNVVEAANAVEVAPQETPPVMIRSSPDAKAVSRPT